ncbi:DUF4249 domain-containing protein [Aureispira anguillae]|uniref:DUF4249 domain-containing protein n=1 Tax=Aureispira anguillae TaxID=2864201 RepID=A0A915YC09_9BACT|nr:DUF4249 domain-containing protein [Aureispira anguillae]BDS10304.1 DUF4249 domain-containing protein [Aureispira anguillae]
MKTISYLVLLSITILLSSSCEKEFIPETTFDEPELVVEGYISKGPNALPPYVILTKSIEYTATIGSDLLNDLFVHNAQVSISDGTNSVQLQEFCVSDLQILPAPLRDAIAQAIGLPAFDIDSIDLDVCVYTDLLGIVGLGLNIEEGGQYDLEIKTEDFGTITSSTTIPYSVPIDSLTYINHPSYPANDSLVEVLAYFQDPIGPNYYRSFSQRNREPMYSASARGINGSVSDDTIFEGQGFSFAILRGQDPLGDFDFDTFGYFWRGDTVTIRAACLDYAHFRFWQTSEYNTGSQGPFGTYTRIESNIKGGLGIWGGISYREKTLIIPE